MFFYRLSLPPPDGFSSFNRKGKAIFEIIREGKKYFGNLLSGSPTGWRFLLNSVVRSETTHRGGGEKT
jgi:hypothetical protein